MTIICIKREIYCTGGSPHYGERINDIGQLRAISLVTPINQSNYYCLYAEWLIRMHASQIIPYISLFSIFLLVQDISGLTFKCGDIDQLPTLNGNVRASAWSAHDGIHNIVWLGHYASRVWPKVSTWRLAFKRGDIAALNGNARPSMWITLKEIHILGGPQYK